MNEYFEIYKQSQELAQLSKQDLVGAGELLRQIRDEFPKFFDAAVSISGIGKRKAYYLLQIQTQFGDFNIPAARLNAIGWTKLQMIGPHVTEENCELLLQMAEHYKAHQVKAILKGEKPLLKGRCVLLYFTQEQYKIFSAAVVASGAIKKRSGIIGTEAALIAALSKS